MSLTSLVNEPTVVFFLCFPRLLELMWCRFAVNLLVVTRDGARGFTLRSYKDGACEGAKFQFRNKLIITTIVFLGPFHGAIAVPSVTRCRCCCCRRRCRGHRCAGGVRQCWCATVATPGEWRVRRLAVAQHFSNASCSRSELAKKAYLNN